MTRRSGFVTGRGGATQSRFTGIESSPVAEAVGAVTWTTWKTSTSVAKQRTTLFIPVGFLEDPCCIRTLRASIVSSIRSGYAPAIPHEIDGWGRPPGGPTRSPRKKIEQSGPHVRGQPV